MERHQYRPQGVCSRQIDFETENGKVYNVVFTGGCNGNLKAIAKLIEGEDITRIISLLEGNTCRGSMRGNTSCADQLTKALKEVL